MIDNYTIPFLAFVVILFGIIHEEKLIAFEDWLADRIGWLAAQVVIKYRRRKRAKQAKITQNRHAVAYQHR